MTTREFVTVDVFTDRAFSGNPLAVFPDATGLSDAEMQALAREFNLSETSFVLPPNDPANTARLRIFTPVAELPFAGHPNIGTAFVLAGRDTTGRRPLVFEQAAGPVTLRILHGADGVPQGAELDAPHSLTLGVALEAYAVAACAQLEQSDIRVESHAPLVAGVGSDFIIAEVQDADTLARARPDPVAFREMIAETTELPAHIGLHLYARDASDPTRLYTRMFAPLSGINEDPATGSANAALAALLVSLAPGEDVTLAFDVAQGIEMGRPSRLLATASKTAEGAVIAGIGGNCVVVMRGTVNL